MGVFCRAVLVEAFAAAPLQGNGAAVVLLERAAGGDWMQRLAASLKQSETAFLWRRGAADWALRWFTPGCEVPLCGHATLAATLALGHWGELECGRELCLASRSGGLRVRLEHRPQGAVSLVLPAGPMEERAAPDWLGRILGCNIDGYWHVPALGYSAALLPDDFALAQLAPIAKDLQGEARKGLVLMQAADGAAPDVLGHGCDYQIRFFAPALGVDEDPVTGSAHALVAPWWMQHLGKERVIGWQASGNGGGMLCEAAGPGFVRLTGTGHLLWDGRMAAAGAGCDPDGWRHCSGG